MDMLKAILTKWGTMNQKAETLKRMGVYVHVGGVRRAEEAEL